VIENSLLFSIVTVVYNGVNTIEQTIKSVLGQTYSNLEYIIVDGGSTDGTLDIIKQYEKAFAQKNVAYKFISEPDKGIYDAMNKGIMLTNGAWVGIINSDDYYENEALAFVKKSIDSNARAELVYGNLNFINEAGEIKIEKPKPDLSLLINTMTIFHPTTFIKRSVYMEHGLFNLKYKLCADWDLILRLYLKKVNFCHVDELLANFRNGGAGSGFKMIHLKERYQIRHSHKNNMAWKFDLKDVLILIYFKVYYKKSAM
jgi:glycosyltransferase involved in cell wall biosynthesis